MTSILHRTYRPKWRVAPWAAAVLVLGTLASCDKGTSRHVVLATTTSLGNSGLLDVLLQEFRRHTGIEVRPHLVGSGFALRMLAEERAALAISHAPEAEASRLREHPSWRYRKIMFNDFVLVGPKSDPAGVTGSATAEQAMRRIATSPVTFLSRGDSSGTHEREEELWRLAGIRPPGNRLVVAGAGMGTTLRIADNTGAYTLTDRATFVRSGMRELVVVFEGGALMLNTYAAILNESARGAREAQTLFRWLSDGDGRRVISEYRTQGERTFFAWPGEASREDPHAVPH